jgi:DNA-binding NtrC family response regulator
MPHRGRDAGILVVEDDVQTRELVRRELSRYGRPVRVAADLATARSEIAERIPAATFLDVRLPDGDGIDLLLDLRGRDPQARVAMMTAYADVEVAVRAFRAGACDFLEKPFDQNELHRVARDVLQEGGTLEVPDLKIETAERLLIVRALAVANGSKTRAAELLGINRATLYNKLKAYGLGSSDGDTDSLKKPEA